MSGGAVRDWLVLTVGLVAAVLLFCGAMAVYEHVQGGRCARAGGQLEWSVESRTGYVCVRDQVVIHP
jgi:hypothetical protein